ncbi:MAG: hypothetical protein CVT95_04020, partial [Bacteroidetes bacterium HGW-Bacteroidetes-12]
MKKIVFIFLFATIANFVCSQSTQQNINQEMSPNGIFDEVFDRFGTKYSLEDIRIDTRLDSNNVQKSVFLCSGGYFDLYFEANSGMDGSSPIQVARRNVICQLFNDLSQFIVPANPNVKVNIWVRDIANIISSPATSGVLGLASGFYTMPSNAPTFRGIVDNEIWKTINSGTNSYTNVTSPLNSLGGPNASFYHGVVAFNFSDPTINWHTDLSQTTLVGLYDMYTVALHEATHALGFASLIDANGASKLGVNNQYYSRYDLFLQTSTNQPLITNTGSCSLYNFGFNTSLNPNVMTPSPFNCSTHIQFTGSVNQAAYTPSTFAAPSSLSHLEDMCHTPNSFPNDEYYVMSDANGTGATFMKRYLKSEERKVLCDIGYTVNTFYGNAANLNFFNYGGTACPGLQVAGINDGIGANSFFQYTVAVGNTIPVTGILSNDFNAVSFECLQDIYGNGTVNTTSGTTFNYTATSIGLALLRYIPVSSNGNRGNITYIYIYVLNGSCIPNACDVITNGGFENNLNCGQMGNFSEIPPPSINCWNPFSATPDLYVRNCIPITNFNITVPTTYCNPTSDTWNNGANLNNAMLGLWAVHNTGNEAIQNNLSSPIQPNSSVNYVLSFRARVANNFFGSQNLPATLIFAGTQNQVPPIFGWFNSTPATLSTLAYQIVPNNNQWNYFSIPFTNSNTFPINYLTIINAAYSTSNPTNHSTYVLIDEISILVDGTQPLFTPPSTLCINQILPDLSLYVAPSGGVFSGNGVMFNSSTGIYSFDPSLAGVGNHSITYTYTSSSGCVYDVTAIIEVVNSTINLSVTASTTSICTGESVTLTASGATTYVWNPGNFLGNPYVVSPTTTTTFTVTATDVNGCTATSSVTVTVAPNCITNPDCILPTTLTLPNGSTSAISIPNGSVVDVQGLFTITSTTTYTNVKFRMAAGARIAIDPSVTLTLSKCHLFSCTQLWEEITVTNGANLVVENYTIIEDANNAIHWMEGGFITVDRTIFNRNITGIKLSSVFTANQIPANIQVGNTIFTCRNFPATLYQTNFNNGSFATLKDNLFNNNTAIYPLGSVITSTTPNTRSQHGVLSSFTTATIGINSFGKSTHNLFDYLDFGIKVFDANFTVINNQFANLTGYVTRGNFMTGVGVWATDPRNVFSMTIGGTNNKEKNTFNNCYRGANISDYRNISFINNELTNTLTSPSFPIFTNNTGRFGLAVFNTLSGSGSVAILTYTITGNTINNYATGIFINRNSTQVITQNIQLANNKIDVTGTNTYCNQGIWMQSLAGSNAVTGSVNVTNNTVKNCERNALLFENVNNMLNIDINNELSVKFNTNSPKQVIRLNSCEGALVSNNTNISTTNNSTIPSATNFNNAITGIYLNNCQGSVVTCNTINFVDVGVLFDQPNSLSQFRTNIMNKAQYGLVLANGAIIGQQGSATQPSGNEWGRNDNNNITLNHTFTLFTPGANTNSPLFCKPNVGPQNCAVGGFKTFPCSNGSDFPGAEYFPSTTPGGGLFTATGLPPFCTARLGNPLDNAKALLHQADSAGNSAVDKFLKKRQAFHLIKTDTTGTLMADNELSSFFNQELNQNIGKISTTNELIGSNDLATAQSTNNSIIPTNVAEHNTKAVNEIWLTSLLDTNYVLTMADSTTLYTIGNICIQQGGDATVLARNLLGNFIQEALYFNDCMEFPIGTANNRITHNKTGASNLILNGSIEDINWDTTGYAMLAPWEFPQFGSPDVCPISSCGPNFPYGYQAAQHGTYYFGCTYFASNSSSPPNVSIREPVIAKTSVTLSSGKQYCLSYYISLADTFNCAVNRSDAYFSPTPMDPTLGTSPYLIYIQPHVMADSTVFYTDKLNWMRIEGSYTAVGNENYITIGNLHQDNWTDTLCNGSMASVGLPDNKQAYYYMDNFSLEEITPANAGVAVTINSGDTASIGNNLDSASTYVWSPNVFINDVNALNPTVNPPTTTTYYV